MQGECTSGPGKKVHFINHKRESTDLPFAIMGHLLQRTDVVQQQVLSEGRRIGEFRGDKESQNLVVHPYILIGIQIYLHLTAGTQDILS